MATAERKRPWYLVSALLGALALGAYGASGGWTLMTFYRETIDPAQVGQAIANEADRVAVVERVRALLTILDADKSRGWPLAVAAMILGSAVTVFAIRALGGSRAARTALMQLVIAQAGLDAASHWLLRDVERAEIAVGEAVEFARQHATADRARAEELVNVRAISTRVVVPVFLGLRLLGSVLVVVALTRRRSRDFFDAMAGAIEER